MNQENISVEFVFGKKDLNLISQLNLFWKEVEKSYNQEMTDHKNSTSSSNQINANISPSKVTSLRREPAAIAKDQKGCIIGIVFVTLTKLENEPNNHEYVYFQRMFMLNKKRQFQISNQLYSAFVKHFKKAINERDPRAQYLMAENANPGLRRASLRRYFFRHGFRMLGINHLGYEIWRMKLETK
jgi:hypothetical protein